jgi:hypothetical protein
MASTIIDLIAANIVTVLEGITVDAGYEVTIGKAIRPGGTPSTDNSLEAVVICRDVTVVEDDSAADYLYQVDWAVVVSVIESDTLETTTETTRLKAGFDVIKALNADVTRGGYSYDTIFQRMTPIVDEETNQAGIIVTFTTPFRSSRSDPYTQNEP